MTARVRAAVRDIQGEGRGRNDLFLTSARYSFHASRAHLGNPPLTFASLTWKCSTAARNTISPIKTKKTAGVTKSTFISRDPAFDCKPFGSQLCCVRNFGSIKGELVAWDSSAIPTDGTNVTMELFVNAQQNYLSIQKILLVGSGRILLLLQQSQKRKKEKVAAY